MDVPCAGKDEPLPPVAGACAPRAPLAEASGRGRCAEDGGNDAAGLDEADHCKDGRRSKGIVDAGDLGDGTGRCGRAKSHQRVALSGRYKAA